MNEQLASSLKGVYRARRSGVLVAEARGVKRSLTFRNGFIVAARSSLKAERLGQMLIRKGRITQQQLKDASVFIKSGWKMGEILAELRIIDKEEITSFVALLVMDIACSMLLDADSTFVFSELTEVEAVVTKPLTVAAVLMEAGHRTSDIDAELKALRQENRFLELAPDPLIQFQDLSLTAEQGFLLSRIQGTERPAAIFSLSPLSEEETARTLLGLLLTGIVRLGGESKPAEVISDDDASEEVGLELAAPESPAPEAASREEIERLFDEFHAQDHWQLLGLSRGASTQDVKMAFHEKARRYHPDRYRSITDERFHEKLSYIFHRLQEAFETLSSETGATRYATLTAKETEYATGTSQWEPPSEQAIAGDSSPGGALASSRQTAEADALFATAKRAYGEGDHWRAIQLCQQAIEIVGDKADYYHLLGLSLAENPKWRADAARNLQIAAKLDPWDAKYFVALGELYTKSGLRLRAKRMFEQAKAVDPDVAIPE